MSAVHSKPVAPEPNPESELASRHVLASELDRMRGQLAAFQADHDKDSVASLTRERDEAREAAAKLKDELTAVRRTVEDLRNEIRIIRRRT